MECGRRTLLFILSIISFGTALAMSIWFIILFHKYKLDKGEHLLFVIAIAIVCFLGFVFIFSLVASCCGGRCSLNTLALLFILTEVFVITFLVLIILRKGDVINVFYDVWQKNVDSSFINSLQTEFKCCGFSNSSDYPSNNCEASLPGCAEPIRVALDDQIFIIIFLVIAAILFLIGIFVAFRQSCAEAKQEEVTE